MRVVSKKSCNFAGMKQEKGKICVFAASSNNIDNVFIDQAYELGKIMSERGWGCVNGSGKVGLMRAVSDGVLDNGGLVTGVIPKFMVDNDWGYDRVSEEIITCDMHDRKQMMSDLATAFIALPGGCGTLEELLEAITWRQLAIITKPIVILNTAGFYTPLIEMLNQCMARGFMKTTHACLWNVANTPQQAIDIIEQQLEQGVAVSDTKFF